MSRHEPSLTRNGRYLYALQLAISVARAAGEKPVLAKFRKRNRGVRDAIGRHFYRKGLWRESPLERWARAGELTTWESWSVDFPDDSTSHGFSLTRWAG